VNFAMLRGADGIGTLGSTFNSKCPWPRVGAKNTAPKNLKDASTMTQHQIDSNTLRAELRSLPRGSLLVIAERAIELVSHDQLVTLSGDIIQINDSPTATDANSVDAAPFVEASLLDEVPSFHNAAMQGESYEHVKINNKGRREQSADTDAFIAEFDRLMRKCISASATDIKAGTGRSP
jgi:hypothetical protein